MSWQYDSSDRTNSSSASASAVKFRLMISIFFTRYVEACSKFDLSFWLICVLLMLNDQLSYAARLKGALLFVTLCQVYCPLSNGVDSSFNHSTTVKGNGLFLADWKTSIQSLGSSVRDLWFTNPKFLSHSRYEWPDVYKRQAYKSALLISSCCLWLIKICKLVTSSTFSYSFLLENTTIRVSFVTIQNKISGDTLSLIHI